MGVISVLHDRCEPVWTTCGRAGRRWRSRVAGRVIVSLSAALCSAFVLSWAWRMSPRPIRIDPG